MEFFGKTKKDEVATPGQPRVFSNLQENYTDSIGRVVQGGEDSSALVVQMADSVLDSAIKERASDIHIELHGEQMKVRFRVDGLLEDYIHGPSHPNFPLNVRFRILAGFDPTPPNPFRVEDGRFMKNVTGRPVQFRVSSFPTVDGEKLVLRVMDHAAIGLPLEQVGFLPDDLTLMAKLIQSTYGIIFVTGATGSGKTTTLYAMLQRLNRKETNIMTLEDPVEYRLDGMNQAQISARTGFTFEEGLRVILRQDPNVIMVGEIRDASTAEIAMRASLTGHLVLTTLHTINATAVIERLFEVGMPPYLMTSSILGAIAQRLVRKLCVHCAQPTNPPTQEQLQASLPWMTKEEADQVYKILQQPTAQFKQPMGCSNCGGRGYVGRLGIFEVMHFNEALRNHTLNRSSGEVIRNSAIQSGMRTLWMDGAAKVAMGVTTWDEVMRVTKAML
ncbi:MAG: type II/IV secretion system protein [Elusimicrobia bacterium]|nr:type II/IV secretion system protein [Elusimicrobiota bacterium]